MSSRTILITGANSGVGFAASKVIASASDGFHIIMAGRSLEKMNTAKAGIEAAGIKGSLSTVRLDVTDDETIEEAVAPVNKRFGQFDVLVNNAAVGSRDLNVRSRMHQSMETNVVGPAVVAAAFRPLLLKSPMPYYIYVSSGAGSLERAAANPTTIGPGYLPRGEAYRASKAALNMLAIQEHTEQKDAGLKVFAMFAGFFVSNLRGTPEQDTNPGGMASRP